MKHRTRILTGLLGAALLLAAQPFDARAGGKGYSSGGRSYSSSSHSYSSHSSHGAGSGGGHTFSSGSSRLAGGGTSLGGGRSSDSGNRSFTSGGGKSYSARPTGNDENRHGYSSGRSYSASTGNLFRRSTAADQADEPRRSGSSSGPRDASSLAFDVAAARARSAETSRKDYERFKANPAGAAGIAATTASGRDSAGGSGAPAPVPLPSVGTPSYRVQPPPAVVSGGGYQPTVYVPETRAMVSRPARVRVIFGDYYSRPVVVYRDPYSSLFWWWLLDRSFEDRARWAYHHRLDMDPSRYQALVAQDRQLEERVAELEAQQAPRDPTYTPAGLDRDLMYSEGYVARAYHNRPTLAGVILFWGLGIPTAMAVCVFFIWLIWFKRWQPPTRP